MKSGSSHLNLCNLTEFAKQEEENKNGNDPPPPIIIILVSFILEQEDFKKVLVLNKNKKSYDT